MDTGNPTDEGRRKWPLCPSYHVKSRCWFWVWFGNVSFNPHTLRFLCFVFVIKEMKVFTWPQNIMYVSSYVCSVLRRISIEGFKLKVHSISNHHRDELTYWWTRVMQINNKWLRENRFKSWQSDHGLTTRSPMGRGLKVIPTQVYGRLSNSYTKNSSRRAVELHYLYRLIWWDDLHNLRFFLSL